MSAKALVVAEDDGLGRWRSDAHFSQDFAMPNLDTVNLDVGIIAIVGSHLRCDAEIADELGNEGDARHREAEDGFVCC